MSSIRRQSNSENQLEYSKIVALDQDDFDVAFFDRILDRQSGNVDVIRRQAELHSKQGNYQAALKLDQQLIEILPKDRIVRYNLACSLALTEQITRAINQLRMAIQLGYRDFARIESDSDLDMLRNHPDFIALLEEFQDDPYSGD